MAIYRVAKWKKRSPTTVNKIPYPKLKCYSSGADFTLKDLTLNADPDKYLYSGYGRWFDSHSTFLILDSLSKNFIIFGVDNSSSVHVDNKKEDSLFLGKVPTQGFHGTTKIAEAEYSINIAESGKRFVL